MFSKSSLRDRLTITTDNGKIELTEQELSRVSGGLKIKMQEVFITSLKIAGVDASLKVT